MPRRIALVEDDAAIRANYADALRKHGHDVQAYGTRAEAMTAAVTPIANPVSARINFRIAASNRPRIAAIVLPARCVGATACG